MAWVQAFPTDSTLISQSVAQIQANWLYIQQTMQKDHYFDNATASNDGHHKFVHLPTTTDQAIILTGVIYQKVNGAGNPMLYYRTAANGIMQIPTSITGSTVLNAGAGTFTLFNAAGRPAFNGILSARETAASNNRASAVVSWNRTTARADKIATNGLITNISWTGTTITVTKTAGACTLAWTIIKTEA